MKHNLLNNGRPLADTCYVSYQNQINLSAECLSQNGDVCINQISVENEHQFCTGSILNVIQGPGSASSGNALKNLIHTDFIQPLTVCWRYCTTQNCILAGTQSTKRMYMLCDICNTIQSI